LSFPLIYFTRRCFGIVVGKGFVLSNLALPKVELTAAASDADAVVLGWFQEEVREKEGTGQPALRFQGKRSKEIDVLASKLRSSKHFFGKKNETNLLRFFSFANYGNVLLLGLGSARKWNAEVARQAGAAVSLCQRKERLPWLDIHSDSLFSGEMAEIEYLVQAFCEGYLLAGYEYRELKKPDKDLFVPSGIRLIGLKGNALESAADAAAILAESTNFARFLGDRPGNHLTPVEFARQVASMAKQSGLKCTVWGKAEIEKEKMGLLLGVSRGSAEEPRFIILQHLGGKKKDPPVALVGKGITFDSGGISLKPPARMEDMKYDMMGAAAVAGICRAIAELDLPINVMGIIATCENMPDGRAQKPGDVARSRSGKTVEIINTDAEGRLILADALDYAQSQNPQAIIDFATLTGAVIDALGTVTSGIMGNSNDLLSRIKTSASVTGERVWELPLFDEYEEDLKSNVADIKNSGIREAGSSKGGTFLKFFVDPKFPWVHCDIAGTAYHRKEVNYHPAKYGSGVMVRLITHMLAHWESVKANS
jgi:leucyl aminopeptidase